MPRSNAIEDKAKRFVRDEEKLVVYEWNHYKTFLTALVIVITLYLYLTGYLQFLMENLGSFGYLGGFVSGFLYTFGITTPLAIASFLVLSEYLNPLALVILGSLGGLISEYFIYEFAKKEARKTIKIYKNKRLKLPEIKSKFLKKISPLIAGLIIASPIPDEFAAALFGIERYKLRDFLAITFACKMIGILFIIELGIIF
jgi:uncharacterized membrane protein YdjX (TVP38/TMEM64 family)